MPIAIVSAVGLALVVAERLAPGVKLPEVRGFHLRAIALNLLQVAAIVLAGLTWDRWLAGPNLVGLSDHLGPFGAGLVGYVVSTFVYYWWHRARHRSRFLWLSCHQVHHSPARLEVLTAFYKHPVEHVANSLLSATIAFPLLGLSPAAAAVTTLLSGLAELVYHVNLRTPRWLGWLIQRPEMHRIHHERGRHAGNYGDLPLWDMIFGTYVNPPRFDGPCGFDPAREARLVDMLRFRDVHTDATNATDAHASETGGHATSDAPRQRGRSGERLEVPFRGTCHGFTAGERLEVPPNGTCRSSAPCDAPSSTGARWRRVALGLWLALGLSQVVGVTLGWLGVPDPIAKAVAAPGRGLLAAPAPKVFCRMGELEPFAYRHEITTTFADGTTAHFELERGRYGDMEGPYALRNVYGAALVFAPLLPERTTEAVLHHAACEAGALTGNEPAQEVVVSSSPRPGALGEPFSQTITCPGASQ